VGWLSASVSRGSGRFVWALRPPEGFFAVEHPALRRRAQCSCVGRAVAAGARSKQIRAFCYCTVCFVMIDAQKIDQFWSTSTLSKVANVDIGRDHQGEAAARRGAGACRRTAREADEPAQRTGGNRACARALHQGRPTEEGVRSQNAGKGSEGG